MLDLNRLHAQFADFSAYQTREQQLLKQKLARAVEALDGCSPAWEALRDRVRRRPPAWLVPDLREAPDRVYPCGERPTPITVVATDGSQVYPDRHVEPTCYLLNISRIAFQYGTLERPLMESVPDFRFHRQDLEALLGEPLASTTAEVVSALRDEQELQALLETARASRLDGRPIVAVADGTLIRWMIRRMQHRALEEKLIARYTEILERFRAERIPLCSYISMPGNTEVVNLLRVHLGEDDDPPPPVEASLNGVMDRWLFAERLRPGERTSTFESASHIQQAYGANRICYFYLNVPGRADAEIARVEVPTWVAEDAVLLDLVHSVILSECGKGEGYPMILAEAHERAVIRTHEKALFYELVERQMRTAGLRYAGSRKAASKRTPTV